jgi:N-acetylneuraminate synthase
MKRIYLDIGSNHNQDFERVKKIIGEISDIKREYGQVVGVKFQLFDPDRLYASGTKYSPAVERLTANRLPAEWIPYLADLADEAGLECGMTIFDMKSLVAFDKMRESFGLKYYMKISSSDLLRKDIIESSALLTNCMDSELHISTGGASIAEIETAVKQATAIATKFPILYHCVMDYPCAPENAALTKIHALADIAHKYNYDEIKRYPDAYKFIGYSDHTASIPVVLKALSWVNICELHFDHHDCAGNEFSVGHCFTPAKLRALCDALSIIELATTHSIDEENKIDLRADPVDGLRPRIKHRGDK